MYHEIVNIINVNVYGNLHKIKMPGVLFQEGAMTSGKKTAKVE